MVKNVIESGDYQTDYQKGRQCGERFIRRLRGSEVSPFYLTSISEGFGNRFGPIEKGFLAEICYTLMQGG